MSFKMSYFWGKKFKLAIQIKVYGFFWEFFMGNLPFSSSSSEELEDVSVEKSESAKGKKGNESQGKFCKDSLTILLSL